MAALEGESSRVVRCPVGGRALSNHCEYTLVSSFIRFCDLQILLLFFDSLEDLGFRADEERRCYR